MSTNVSQFNTALVTASKKIHGDIRKFHKLVCIEAFKRIVQRTPVDTGRSRGNWQIEFYRQATGQVEKSLWPTVFERGLEKLEHIPPFSVVHITNNVDYIYYLEYTRRSEQHPEGMTEITLQELKTWLSKIK